MERTLRVRLAAGGGQAGRTEASGSGGGVHKNLRLWLGLAVSLVFLALAFRNKDLAVMGQSLLTADYRYLAPAVALYFVGVYFRAVRWRALLRSVKPLPASALFPVVVIGYMANNVLPARIGEFVRAYVLSWKHGVAKSATLATVAIERIFDGLTMVAFLLAASLLIRLNEQVTTIAVVATALFCGLLLGLIAVGAIPAVQRLLHGVLGRLLPDRFAARLEAVLTSFIAGLGSLRSRGDLALVAVTSLAAWLCEAGMYLIIAAAFGLGLGWPAALLTTAVANLFTLLPSSPGYVGIFEAGVLAVLVGLLGLPEEAALGYAIVLHAALWLPVTLLGVFFWSRESLSWRELKRMRAEPPATLAEPSLPPTRG
jgi:uncharacterized protein (TIRG00374 family)